jgi:hypothetical protein
VPQYWLKPLGFTQPEPHPLPDDWASERGLDDFELTTGPAKIQNPPQMGRGDRVLLHAVIHARVFAEGEILGKPKWTPNHQWGDRWPWVYPFQIDSWVPLVKDGPRTAECAPKRAMGRIQAGGEYAPLSKQEYEIVFAVLQGAPTLMSRQ